MRKYRITYIKFDYDLIRIRCSKEQHARIDDYLLGDEDRLEFLNRKEREFLLQMKQGHN